MRSMVNMQPEPILLKEVANHEWNPRQTPTQSPALYSEAVNKRCIPRLPGNLNWVKTRWKPPVCPGYPPMAGGGGGLKMIGAVPVE